MRLLAVRRHFWICLLASVFACLTIAVSVAQNGPNTLGTQDRIGNGFHGQIYFLPEGTDKLPEDFSTLEPQGSIYTEELNIAPRSFDKGFPGVTDRFEWFAIEYRTTFHAANAGEYAFRINSDDGTRLYIDGQLVIDNDGIHPPRSRTGKIELASGTHDMVVQYFQGPRYRIALQLFYARSGQEEAVFPGKDFSLTTPDSCSWLWWLLAALVIAVLVLAALWRRRRRRSGQS